MSLRKGASVLVAGVAEANGFRFVAQCRPQSRLDGISTSSTTQPNSDDNQDNPKFSKPHATPPPTSASTATTPTYSSITCGGANVSSNILHSLIPNQLPQSSHPNTRMPYSGNMRQGLFTPSAISHFSTTRFTPHGWLPQQYNFRNSNPFVRRDRAVTNGIMGINIGLFALQMVNPSITRALSQVNFAVWQGEWWRMITAGFMHANLIHLAANMFGLHHLGEAVERSCTSKAQFITIYTCALLSSSLVEYFQGPLHHMSLGASGAVFGMFTALIVHRYRNRHTVGFDQNDINWILQVVGLNVVLAMVSGFNIAHWAHFGGALGGAAAMFLLGPRYRYGTQGYIENKPIIPLFKSRR